MPGLVCHPHPSSCREFASVTGSETRAERAGAFPSIDEMISFVESVATLVLRSADNRFWQVEAPDATNLPSGSAISGENAAVRASMTISDL